MVDHCPAAIPNRHFGDIFGNLRVQARAGDNQILAGPVRRKGNLRAIIFCCQRRADASVNCCVFIPKIILICRTHAGGGQAHKKHFIGNAGAGRVVAVKINRITGSHCSFGHGKIRPAVIRVRPFNLLISNRQGGRIMP